MARLVGPFGEIWELGPLADPSREGEVDARALSELYRALQLLVRQPENVEALRALLAEHAPGSTFERAPAPYALARQLGEAVTRGRLFLMLRRPGWAGPQLPSRGGSAGTRLRELAPPAPPTQAAPPQEPAVEKILDWKIGCQHEIDGRQRMTERGTRIQVVPDGEGGASDKKDIVGLWYRNDHEPPPGSLRYAPSGGADLDAADNGVEGGGYHHYPVAVEFLGDTSISNFLRPAYWTAFNSRTTYTVRDGPAPITVDVHYPYTWTFTFSLPPLAGYKCGSKLEAEVHRKEGGGLVPGKVEHAWKRELSGFSPSTLTQVAARDWGTVGSDGSAQHDAHVATAKPMVQGIKLTRSDGYEAEINLLEMVGQFCWLVTNFNRVVDNILDVAPKIGWYIDLEVQVMQGSVAIAWGWKEWQDHTAYRWVDFRIELTILSVRLEFGFGVSGLSFAAQLYAAVQGDVTVSAEGQRPSPEIEASVEIPLEGEIKGMLGVRFEAGYIFKIDAHGATGLRVQVDLRLNDGNRPLSLNGETTWTGVEVKATVSAGLFGIGGQKTWQRQLVRPMALAKLNWPKAEPYNPPWIDRQRMEAVLRRVLTSGLNVRVFKPSGSFFKGDEQWPIERIVDTLATKLDANQTMRRDQNSVEGMAHGIRHDLDAIGARLFRDWITEEKFLEYVHGPGLAKRMSDARDLGRELLQKCGG